MHIDVHTHFFNAHYLPILGIAVKRGGVPRPVAGLLQRAISAMTCDDDSLESDEPWAIRRSVSSPFTLAPEEDPEPADLSAEQAIEEFVRLVPPGVLRSPEFEAALQLAQADAMLAPALAAVKPQVGDIEARREQLRRLLNAGPEPLAGGAKLLRSDDEMGPGVGGFLQFFLNLRSREKVLVDASRRNQPGVGLFVYLMMDMQWPYESEPRYDYPRAIRRTRRLCRQSGGSVVPFVAFDAYRPDSLELVKDALLRQAFVGVKFYAPSGYRPHGNRRENVVLEGVAPELVDQRCERLVRWCAANDIPIMAHCTPQGMEVAPEKHSGHLADPAHWGFWLERFPSLRLCFGHGGGHGYWLDDPGRPAHDGGAPNYPWATTILDLCQRYPNVYLDLSHLGELLDADGGARFARQLIAALKRWPEAARKLMYGTDYPMPLPYGGWKGYYSSVLETFQGADRLAPLVEDVFRENAARYLNLGGYLARCGATLGPEEIAYLRQFLARP